MVTVSNHAPCCFPFGGTTHFDASNSMFSSSSHSETRTGTIFLIVSDSAFQPCFIPVFFFAPPRRQKKHPQVYVGAGLGFALCLCFGIGFLALASLAYNLFEGDNERIFQFCTLDVCCVVLFVKRHGSI